MPAISHVTFASEDPDELAAFWEQALDHERQSLPDGTSESTGESGASGSEETVLLAHPGDGPDLLFMRMPGSTPEHMPIHLDIEVENREPTVDRLETRGGTIVETKSEEFGTETHTWTVMEDPEGNGFCVAEA